MIRGYILSQIVNISKGNAIFVLLCFALLRYSLLCLTLFCFVLFCLVLLCFDLLWLLLCCAFVILQCLLWLCCAELCCAIVDVILHYTTPHHTSRDTPQHTMSFYTTLFPYCTTKCHTTSYIIAHHNTRCNFKLTYLVILHYIISH